MSGKYFVVTGRTESGDDLTPILFIGQRPTNDEIEKILKETYPEEYDEVGFVNWGIDEPDVMDTWPWTLTS